MSRHVETIAGSVMHLVLLVLVVTSILLSGKWVRTDRDSYGKVNAELPALEALQAEADAHRDRCEQQVSACSG